MSKSKRFQSGREIFEHYIPNYEADSSKKREVSERADILAENIICEFADRVSKGAKQKPIRAR